MTEPTTEPGKWLVAEYARTPGDPKWYPGLGLESTVIAIEAEAGLLNVERLARAVSLVMSDLDWTPAPIGVVQNSYWQDRAEGIAREYDALAAIEGDKE